MNESILQKFIDARLLNTFLKNKEDIADLQKAVDEFGELLSKKENRKHLSAYILLGINPNISEEEPLLDAVEVIIKEHLQLLLIHSNNRPVVVLRAVILGALEIVASKGTTYYMDYSKKIYLLAKKTFGRVQYENKKEEKIISDFLTTVGERANNYALEGWQVNISLPKAESVDFSLEILAGGRNKQSVLAAHISKIPLPKGKSVQTGYRDSSKYISEDAMSTWYSAFSKKIAAAIRAEINSQLSDVNVSIEQISNSISDKITGFANDLQEKVNTQISSSLSGIESLVARDKLNWWKESLFSASIRKSYREVKSPVVLGIIMSHDYCKFLPNHCPESVDYFLLETFNRVCDSKESLTFASVMEALEADDSVKNILSSSGSDNIQSVPDFLVSYALGKGNTDQFELFTYILPITEISPADLCLWFFHYFQSNKLLHGN